MLGTVEVIKLATTNTIKTVHYVSTLSTMIIPIGDEKKPDSPRVEDKTKSTIPASRSGTKLDTMSQTFSPRTPVDKKEPLGDRNSVKSPKIDLGTKYVYETNIMPAATEIHGGYAQSKWVAEQV